MDHSRYIKHCLELAERGRGKTRTNPMVGCVILNADNEIVAEGWHVAYGEKHAEIDAMTKLATCNLQPATFTLYVNLEPCCTHGKQPPCTDAIIESEIQTVVFGARDPSNSGANVLRDAGVTVIGPIMEPVCRRFNRGFFSLIEQSRPWVTVKKAMRANGSINGKITDEEQDAWAHTRLRATHDAILVGAGTVIADDPKLTIRFRSSLDTRRMSPRVDVAQQHRIEGPYNGATRDDMFQPLRIILDPHSQIPPTAKVLTDEFSDRTIVISEKKVIPDLLTYLKDIGIASVLIEGGPSVWKSFEDAQIIDEIVVLSGNA